METDFILSLARAATASTAVEPEPELEPVQYRISGCMVDVSDRLIPPFPHTSQF